MPERNPHPTATSRPERWKPPFMPWYEGDFSGSFRVRQMRPLTRLMYRSLLQAAWRTDNPPYIPNDDDTLMLMADAPSRKNWENVRETILECFQKTDDGNWLFHPKSLREFNRALAEHERKVQAGEQRWRATQEHSSRTPPAEHQQADTAPLNSHNYNQSTTKTRSTDRANDAFNSTEVAQILCSANGWSGKELIWALTEAIEFKASQMKNRSLQEVGVWLIDAYKEHQRVKGNFAVGPMKFFAEARYQSSEPSSKSDLPTGSAVENTLALLKDEER